MPYKFKVTFKDNEQILVNTVQMYQFYPDTILLGDTWYQMKDIKECILIDDSIQSSEEEERKWLAFTHPANIDADPTGELDYDEKGNENAGWGKDDDIDEYHRNINNDILDTEGLRHEDTF